MAEKLIYKEMTANTPFKMHGKLTIRDRRQVNTWSTTAKTLLPPLEKITINWNKLGLSCANLSTAWI